jgi:hypothetical protein
MSAIEKWMKGKHFLFALFAPHIAILARDMHEDFQQTKERRFMDHQFPLPHFPSWVIRDIHDKFCQGENGDFP